MKQLKSQKINITLFILSYIFGLIITLNLPYSFFSYKFLSPYNIEISRESPVNSDIKNSNISGYLVVNGNTTPFLINKNISKFLGLTQNDIGIRFNTGPSSGITSIKYLDNIETIDLYSSDVSYKDINYPLKLHSKIYLGLNILLLIIISSFLGRFLLHLLKKITQKINIKPKKDSLNYLPIIGLIVLIPFIYWLAFYPGLMTPDSIDQWKQATTLQIKNNHPAIHTILIWFLTRIWNSPAVVSLLQVIIFCLIVWNYIKTYKMLRISNIALLVSAFILLLLPANGMMVITLWKDIGYALSVAWLVLLLIKTINKQEILKENKHKLALVISLLFISTFRHNGIMVGIGSLILLSSFFYKNLKEILIITLFYIISIYIIMNPFYKIIHAESLTSLFPNYIQFYQTAAVIAGNGDITDKERDYLYTFLTQEEWEKYYSCISINPLGYDANINYSYYRENSNEFNKIWISLIKNNPIIISNHQQCISNLVWQIPQKSNNYLYTVEKEIIKNDLGLKTESKLPVLKEFFVRITKWTEKPEYIWFFWRPAIYLLLLLIITMTAIIKTNNYRWFLIAVPPLLNSFSLVIGGVSQDFRYQYSVYLISLLLIPVLFMPNKKISKKGNRDQTKNCSSL